MPPEEVPWASTPVGADWLADELRLSKGGFLYFWRSYLDPAWSHHIRGPVRIWSVDGGPDEQALAAGFVRPYADDPDLWTLDSPFFLAGQEKVPPRTAPVTPGQHSDEVLRQYGYGDAKIAELREARVVA